MAACTPTAACFSGRTLSLSRKNSREGPAPRRRELCSAHSFRSSLEEEFKKQLLDTSLGGASSSGQERLKDLSAHASRFNGELNRSSSTSSGATTPGLPPLPPASASSAAPDAIASSSSEDAAAAGPFSAASNLPFSSEPYHPLEFYSSSSQIDMTWGAAGLGAAANGAASTDSGEAWLGAPAGDRARCFVILFGVGRAETEGIYSLRAVAKDDGLPVDTIVAFENEDDALRYSTLLEATMDHEPTVWPIEWGELLEFCNSAGYRCRLEPAGSLLIPPDYNVGMTDWEKSLKLRKGEFSVLGAEPLAAGHPSAASTSFFLDGPDWIFESAAVGAHDEEVHAEQLSAVIDSQLSSPSQLAAMRASLERLLPHE